MNDFSKEKIELPCPDCNTILVVTVEQVSKEEMIICPSCGEETRLIDDNQSAKKAISDINNLFKDIDNLFK